MMRPKSSEELAEEGRKYQRKVFLVIAMILVAAFFGLYLLWGFAEEKFNNMNLSINYSYDSDNSGWCGNGFCDSDESYNGEDSCWTDCGYNQEGSKIYELVEGRKETIGEHMFLLTGVIWEDDAYNFIVEIDGKVYAINNKEEESISNMDIYFIGGKAEEPYTFMFEMLYPAIPNPIIHNCSDSDGRDYYIKGQAKTTNGNYQWDRCANRPDNRLIEAYCNENLLYSEFFDCPGNCEDGACVS